MRIKKVSFCNHELDWQFEPIHFSDLALLVGVSGVGKTQILKGIFSLKEIANGKSLNGLAWDITFLTKNEVEYQWIGEFETQKQPGVISEDQDESSRFKIICEKLWRNGDLIIERTPHEIQFQGKITPKLSPFQSVVHILNQEDKIAPVQKGFNKIIYSEHYSSLNAVHSISCRAVADLKKENLPLYKIKDSNMPIPLKLALIYQHHSFFFKKVIKASFIAIFPQIENIKIELIEDENHPFFLDFPVQIKEKGVNKWILQNNISSGMLKTLIHISELILAPEESVIVIDEFENSLGVNCIHVVTASLLKNESLQFILTSHHPYIINNIAMEYWKIVTRRGGVVTVRDAKDFNLGKSRHQAFLQLINLEEYSEGIKV
ncbi:AAA family ATPase [Kamptonema animale CS-326]|jgi:AAA15 family ATPase/GTPase|uniref:AAA family ATPase n=1 Tax=Kamptonema animale TaxID=92934 RepID=UPI00232B8DD5|nr:AAA family ATPase [Kamptonema animale]MDB9512603.1 AAA family ATPase [Kamptonema animale CS-326]